MFLHSRITFSILIGLLLFREVSLQVVETVTKVHGIDTEVHLECPLQLNGVKIEWAYIKINVNGSDTPNLIIGYNFDESIIYPSIYDETKYSLMKDVNGNLTVLVIYNLTLSDSKEYRCDIKGAEEKLGHRVKVEVLNPPEVSVVSTNPDEEHIVENSTLSLKCNTASGNPQKVTSYNWEFKPKNSVDDSLNYGPITSNIGHLKSEWKDLVMTDISYRASGSYRCIVNTTYAQSSGEKEVTVYYSAKQLSGNKVIYAALNSVATIQFNFMVLPFGKPHMNVKWQKHNKSGTYDISPGRTPRKKIQEEKWTTMYVINVDDYSFGNYAVTITNNNIEKRLKPVVFMTELKNKGPPEAPRNVTVIGESPTTLLVTWKVGLSYDDVQYFIIEYKEKGKDYFIKLADRIPAQKSTGEVQGYHIRNLVPNCEYIIRVSSISDYDDIPVPSIGTGTTLDSDKTKCNLLIIILSSTLGGTLFVMLLCCILIIKYKRKYNSSSTKQNSEETKHIGTLFQRPDFNDDIQDRFTDNSDEENNFRVMKEDLNQEKAPQCVNQCNTGEDSQVYYNCPKPTDSAQNDVLAQRGNDQYVNTRDIVMYRGLKSYN